ncbi:MAG: caspase family protein [Elusimicrobia bacterium]|nr:caspase family protein [Elusimicrobiota bacterium]MDE2425210.1 caspase family protein [Elusimicrobiota bacterium]
MRLSLLAACLLSLSGCMPQPAARQDPFANLDLSPAGSPLSGLTLALIPSDNTRAALQYARRGAAVTGQFDPNKLFEDVGGVLRRNFKKVVEARSLAEARAAGADLAVVLDIYSRIPGTALQKASIDLSAIFMSPDGGRIEEVKAGSSARAAVFATAGVGDAMDEASQSVRDQFERTLQASAALAGFARARAPAAAAPVARAQPARTYASDVDRPAYRRADDPNSYALVIGIEKYENLPPADFAERDAAAVRAHLRALGVPERNLIFLTGPQAGKAGIEKYVESWLPRNVPSGARVFVYFSGHGAPDAATGQAYLVPWDGDPKFLEDTGYPIKRLYQKLNALAASRVLVAMDSCFSGAGGRSVLAKGARPLVTKVDTGAQSVGKLLVLAAAGADEITGTDEARGHGVFTYYLLKGLNRTRGSASAKDLYEYLRPRVQDAARRDNRDQTPQLIPAQAEAASEPL